MICDPLRSIMCLNSLVISLVMLLFTVKSRASFSSDIDIVYGGCSQVKYATGSPYQSALNSVFAFVANYALISNYNDVYVTSPDSVAPLSAIYQCRGDLDSTACASCMNRCINRLANKYCSHSTGAFIQLDECFLKYDNVTGLVGATDKSLMSKRCSQVSVEDPDVIGRRNEVLAKLATSTVLYRVVNVAEVRGQAQCVGDLTIRECDDCVQYAGDMLRGSCQNSITGAVYLGKCYAILTIGVAQVPTSSTWPDDNNSKGNLGRTIGIIFGMLAFTAIIIGIAAFFRKHKKGERKKKEKEKEEENVKDKGKGKLEVDAGLA